MTQQEFKDKIIIVTDPGITKKMAEARSYVDTIINMYGRPPTYRQVTEFFGLKSSSAAYSRLRGYRHKMKQNK